MDEVLDLELATFESRRPEFLRTRTGEFALVHGAELAGVFESEIEAVRAGYRQFGNVPFLVKQILREDPVCDFGPFHHFA